MGTMDTKAQIDAMRAELAALQAENAALKAAPKRSAAGKLTLKISQPRAAGTNNPSDKGSQGGALSVYGLGRFPVTLYRSQWERLLEAAPAVQAFIETHRDSLIEKSDVAKTDTTLVTV